MSHLPQPASLILWHASRNDISRPTIEGRKPGENHENSGLGIYCSTSPEEYVVNFGSHIFQIHLRQDVRVKRMDISELLRLSGGGRHDREWFDDLGRQLGQKYDIIDLIEKDGLATQAVILNDEAIDHVIRLTPEEYLALGPVKTSSPGIARI